VVVQLVAVLVVVAEAVVWTEIGVVQVVTLLIRRI
jgi:hypothetical protein